MLRVSKNSRGFNNSSLLSFRTAFSICHQFLKAPPPCLINAFIHALTPTAYFVTREIPHNSLFFFFFCLCQTPNPSVTLLFSFTQTRTHFSHPFTPPPHTHTQPVTIAACALMSPPPPPIIPPCLALFIKLHRVSPPFPFRLSSTHTHWLSPGCPFVCLSKTAWRINVCIPTK